MNVWHSIQQNHIAEGRFAVYITIQKGSNKKYKFDEETGCLWLKEIFYSAACYPMNGGIIPRTLNGMKNPLEAFIVCQEPLELGTLVECSPVGVIQMRKDGRVEDKIIALPILKNMNGIGFVDSEITLKTVYDDIRYFFNTYNRSDGSELWISGEISGIKAVEIMEKSIGNYEKKYRSN